MTLRTRSKRFTPRIVIWVVIAVVAIVVFRQDEASTNPTILSVETSHVKEDNGKSSIVPDDYSGPVTIYEPLLDNKAFPCYREDEWRLKQNTPATEGLLFVREMKVASSTMAGVLLRIAKRKGREQFKEEKMKNGDKYCKVRIEHGSAQKFHYNKRNKNKSFLVSFLREPTKRAISHFFYFDVSWHQLTATDKNFKRSAQQSINYYMNDLAMTPSVEDALKAAKQNNNNNQTSAYDTIVQSVIDEYDFIGITDRMDESLVVLQMLLDLELTDILYMSAKGVGQFIHVPDDKGGRCHHQVPSFLTPAMKDYFASEYWRTSIAPDYALYKAAWASLDRTIDRLGRDTFERQLSKFRDLLGKAQEYCKSRYVDTCDEQGELRTNVTRCLILHLGCTNDCLDEFSNLQRQKQ